MGAPGGRGGGARRIAVRERRRERNDLADYVLALSHRAEGLLVGGVPPPSFASLTRHPPIAFGESCCARRGNKAPSRDFAKRSRSPQGERGEDSAACRRRGPS